MNRKFIRSTIFLSAFGAATIGTLLFLLSYFELLTLFRFSDTTILEIVIFLLLLFALLYYSLRSQHRSFYRESQRLSRQKEDLTREIDKKKNELEEYKAKSEELRQEESRRNWITQGAAEFGQLMRQHQNSEVLYDTIVAHTVKFVECTQGALYLVKDEDADNIHIELAANYAFGRKKWKEKRIEPGQGLIGQCYFEREVIQLREIPKDYLDITSGLGEAPPREICIIPLKENENIEGFLELASFNVLDEYALEFLRTSGELLAGFLRNFKMNSKTEKLLQESRMAEAELREKEEEMRQNLEELEATQESMVRKEKEMEKLLKEVQNAMIENRLKEIELSIDLALTDAKREVEFLSNVPPISGMFRALENDGYDEVGESTYETWVNRMETILENLLHSKTIYNHALIINQNGEVIVFRGFDGAQVFNQGSDGENEAFRIASRRLLSEQFNEVCVAEALENENQNYRFVLAGPLLWKNEIKGTVFLSLFTDRFINVIKMKEDHRLKFRMVDSLGRVFYGNGRDYQELSIKKIDLNERYSLEISASQLRGSA